MLNKFGKRRVSRPPELALALGLVLGAAVMVDVPVAAAQQTLDQYNATNAERQRETDRQNRVRLRRHQQREDIQQGALACQGMGAGQSAC